MIFHNSWCTKINFFKCENRRFILERIKKKWRIKLQTILKLENQNLNWIYAKDVTGIDMVENTGNLEVIEKQRMSPLSLCVCVATAVPSNYKLQLFSAPSSSLFVTLCHFPLTAILFIVVPFWVGIKRDLVPLSTEIKFDPTNPMSYPLDFLPIFWFINQLNYIG